MKSGLGDSSNLAVYLRSRCIQISAAVPRGRLIDRAEVLVKAIRRGDLEATTDPTTRDDVAAAVEESLREIGNRPDYLLRRCDAILHRKPSP